MAPQRVPVNAYEAPGAFVIVAPVPAVTDRDITVELTDGSVRICAELRSAGPRDYAIHEWEYGGYERQVDVPEGYGSGARGRARERPAGRARPEWCVRSGCTDSSDCELTRAEMEYTEITAADFDALDGVADWRVVLSGVVADFACGSFPAAAALGVGVADAAEGCSIIPTSTSGTPTGSG